MKKVLLATTILAASAGFAAADVTVTGTARMGVAYDDSKTDNELSFTNRVRIAFTASGETDGGLSFGASVRADNSDEANDDGSAGTVFISGAFGTITMGDVDEAFGALFGDIAGVGLTGLGDLNELSHSADGGGFGRLPADFLTGVVTEGAYNSLYTLNATKTQYTSTTGAIFGFGDRVDLVWGPLFDNVAYAKEINTAGPALTPLANTDLVNPVDVDGNVTQGNLSAENFAGAVGMGFLQSVYTLAQEAKLVPGALTYADVLSVIPGDNGVPAAPTATANAHTQSVSALLNAYVLGPDAPALELAYSADEDLPSDAIIVGLSIDTSGIKGIPARVLYEYALDGFGFAMGYSQTGSNEAYSIAGSYEINGLKLSAGFARAEWNDAIKATMTVRGGIYAGSGAAAGNVPSENADGSPIQGSASRTVAHDLSADDLNFGVSYTMDAVTVAAVYQDKKFELNGMRVDRHKTTGVSVSYTMDALSLSAFGTQTDADAYAQKARAYGIGAAYDLGGGASVVGGIVDSRGFTGSSKTTADLGVSFTF